MKKYFLSVIIIVLFMSFACSSGETVEKGSKKKASNYNSKTDNKKKDKKDTDLIPVSVKFPVRGDINSFLLFSSNIDSEKTVDIYPLTSGIIEEIFYDEGDAVKKGDILARLDDRDALINAKRSKITYEQQKIEFERQKEIYEKELISREEYEKLRYNLEKSKLDWEQSKLLLSYTRITSPISGLVTKRYIKVGNKITVSQLSFSVVYTKEKIVVINIPEQEKDQIFLKQNVLVTAGDLTMKGYIKRISPAIDPESGTFKVTAEVKDPGNRLVVGQFVNVKVIKKVHKDVILVTKDVLIYEEGRVFVFKVNKEDIAMKIEVKTGFDDGQRVEILNGISTKDRLVSAGKSTLKNNSKVKLVKSLL